MAGVLSTLYWYIYERNIYEEIVPGKTLSQATGMQALVKALRPQGCWIGIDCIAVVL